MIIVDLKEIAGRRYSAGRHTKNIVGGNSPIRTQSFSMGHVTLDPAGGQVPWHNHSQEEVYFILEGLGQICVGRECGSLRAGQAVFIPSGEFHQLTNVGDTPLRMIYCYAPGGDVAHWRQELEGTLPRAGQDAPPLPEGAWPQYTG
ncbi:MAG: cupin domain-containing protein [Kiritimatiellia bacterium]